MLQENHNTKTVSSLISLILSLTKQKDMAHNKTVNFSNYSKTGQPKLNDCQPNSTANTIGRETQDNTSWFNKD